MKKLLLAVAMMVSGCRTVEAPTAHVACPECERDDLMVGDALPVTSSWSGRCEYRGLPSKSSEGELHETECHSRETTAAVVCESGCQVEAGPRGPVVRATAVGTMAFTVRVTNLDTKETSDIPMRAQIHAPQALWMLCASWHSEPLTPCGKKVLKGLSPRLSVVARVGSATRALRSVRVNGRDLTTDNEEASFAWRNFAPDTIAQGQVRPGLYTVVVEAGGARGEAKVELY